MVPQRRYDYFEEVHSLSPPSIFSITSGQEMDLALAFAMNFVQLFLMFFWFEWGSEPLDPARI